MNSRFLLVAILTLLSACSNKIHVPSYAKDAISDQEAQRVRSTIVSMSDYSDIPRLKDRVFYFELCESEMDENGNHVKCDFLVWLGDSKKI